MSEQQQESVHNEGFQQAELLAAMERTRGDEIEKRTALCTEQIENLINDYNFKGENIRELRGDLQTADFFNRETKMNEEDRQHALEVSREVIDALLKKYGEDDGAHAFDVISDNILERDIVHLTSNGVYITEHVYYDASSDPEGKGTPAAFMASYSNTPPHGLFENK